MAFFSEGRNRCQAKKAFLSGGGRGTCRLVPWKGSQHWEGIKRHEANKTSFKEGGNSPPLRGRKGGIAFLSP